MSTANHNLTRQGFADTIGNTPLIRLAHVSAATGCEILGKAEFMNPGGSVKDRAAKWMIEDAERSGNLKPGGIVVEGTAGNTGIGLAHVCNARGYKLIITMPDNQSREKFQTLETLGAEVLPIIKRLPRALRNNYLRQSWPINLITLPIVKPILKARDQKSGIKRTERLMHLYVRPAPAAHWVALHAT